MMKLEHFLMKGRTSYQISEKYGNEGLKAAEHLKEMGFVTSKTENDETVYRVNDLFGGFLAISPDYWISCLHERIKAK